MDLASRAMLDRAFIIKWNLTILPLIIVFVLLSVSFLALSSWIAPRDPLIGWIEESPPYLNQQYTIDLRSDVSCDWQIRGPSWISISGDVNDKNALQLTGMPRHLGNFTISITATQHGNPSLTSEIALPVNVTETDHWGYIETFNGIATGTHGNASFNNVTLYEKTNTEGVILDGLLWIMSRGVDHDSKIMVYDTPPPSSLSGWNLSFETYPPRENSAFRSGTIIGNFALRSYLLNGANVRLAGVELAYGQPGESISLYNASTGNWTTLSQEIMPAMPHNSDDSGTSPDNYIVSYEYTKGNQSRITVSHTSAGLIFSGNVSIGEANISSPKLEIGVNVNMSIARTGGWIVDDIAFRGVKSVYPVVEPQYEYIKEEQPAWVTVKDAQGTPLEHAKVAIEGRYALFNAANGKYEARLAEKPDWATGVNFTVNADGVRIRDSMKLTTMAVPDPARIEQWWNGWDWATVLGLDDASSAISAVSTYSKYNHPTTAYLIEAGGNSTEILPTQSELAIHYPHDYYSMPKLFWDDAVADAKSGHEKLKSGYTFASRWDDPSYVGAGDMYISMANPGDSASFQLMFAEYDRGTRIDGISSNPPSIAAGNASLIGCWWPQQAGVWSTSPGAAWTPYERIDLMDANRAVRTEGKDSSWFNIFYAGERHGLLRVYTHQGNLSGMVNISFLTWLDESKTNYSHENWKATDGEVASYVYGRWSTDVRFDPNSSDSKTDVFRISRQNPIATGYWRVPVTISLDISGRGLSEIKIEENGLTLKMSDNSLRDLNGKRIMDVGYDIRGGRLYISHFWNESSTLTISFSDSSPHAARISGQDGLAGNVTGANELAVTQQDPITGLIESHQQGQSDGALIAPIWLNRQLG